MSTPIAVQLYTVREHLAGDFAGTIEAIARIGYTGVETAGFPDGVTPHEAHARFESLGLTVCSAHLPLPLGEQRQYVLETLDALDCRRLVCAYLPDEEFATVDAIRRTADRLNEAAAIASEYELSFAYHNHWWEFASVAGRPAFDLLLEHLSDDVLLEIDVYWAQTAGTDPITLLQRLGPRAPLLHIKDGPCTIDDPMVAVGDGRVDIPGVIAAGAADWLIVELDRCATDMLTAVERSYTYLVGEGLAHGR